MQKALRIDVIALKIINFVRAFAADKMIYFLECFLVYGYHKKLINKTHICEVCCCADGYTTLRASVSTLGSLEYMKQKRISVLSLLGDVKRQRLHSLASVTQCLLSVTEALLFKVMLLLHPHRNPFTSQISNFL